MSSGIRLIKNVKEAALSTLYGKESVRSWNLDAESRQVRVKISEREIQRMHGRTGGQN